MEPLFWWMNEHGQNTQWTRAEHSMKPIPEWSHSSAPWACTCAHSPARNRKFWEVSVSVTFCLQALYATPRFEGHLHYCWSLSLFQGTLCIMVIITTNYYNYRSWELTAPKAKEAALLLLLLLTITIIWSHTTVMNTYNASRALHTQCLRHYCYYY
jgi:hypothetical protein